MWINYSIANWNQPGYQLTTATAQHTLYPVEPLTPPLACWPLCHQVGSTLHRFHPLLVTQSQALFKVISVIENELLRTYSCTVGLSLYNLIKILGNDFLPQNLAWSAGSQYCQSTTSHRVTTKILYKWLYAWLTQAEHPRASTTDGMLLVYCW